MAKKTIQAGVDVAGNGDTVLVTNGEYVLSGQIIVSNNIVVRSVNGPTRTMVNGNGQVTFSRCFYLGSDCILDGFTLTNGYALNPTNAYGGGAFGGTLTSCMLSGNSAGIGGGAHRSTLNNCTLAGNSAGTAGGAYQSTLNNCTLIGNLAYLGGGAFESTLNNCTLSGNFTASYGTGGGAYQSTLNNCTLTGNSAFIAGAAYQSTLNNCIVYYNTGTPQCDAVTMRYTCAPDAPAGDGNITNEPMFVCKNNGNYRLSAGSPCINAGDNSLAPTNITLVDLDGNLRIWNITVDMGAYEYGSVPPNPAVLVIKANGSSDNVIINNSDNLSITVQIDPEEFAGINVDWWVIALANSSWYYLNSSMQWTPFDGNLSNCHPVYPGALFNLPATEVLNMTGLPVGSYTFWFAVDYPMDGILNPNGQILLDKVTVTVQ
ncbi:MAG: hypothetical protein KKD14_02925 [Verrucomicrobia bacterium]|nr:hypothetical protein [Verrucomicrobiota bacterium]